MILYTKVKRTITTGQTPSVKFLARIWRNNDVDIEALSSEIAEATALSHADIVACLKAFEIAIKRHVMNGEAVKLPALGHFIPCIKAKAQDAKEKVTADTITNKSVRFYPVVSFRQDMKGVSLRERTPNPKGYQAPTN